MGQGFGETLFFLTDDAGDLVGGGRQLRIGVAHFRRQRRNQLMEEGAFGAQLVAVTDRAAHDPAQHVAAPFVGRQHPVGDQERGGADVIGDHPQRTGVQIRGTGRGGGGLDQVLKQVDLVVAVDALHHRRQPLQPHAGIHRGFGQRVQHAIRAPVELHEHQIPDFDVAVAVFVRRPRRAAGDPRTVVVEDFRAGTAGAGIAHRPEVIALVAFAARLVADAGDTLPGNPDFLGPDLISLVVGLIDRHPQPVRRQLQDPGQKLPAEMDGLALEVVAEAEIAQHLEEGVMTGGVADVFQIVVLAAGPHAALGGGRARVGPSVAAGEHIFELHHAGVSEQQGVIVERDQRAAGHDFMAVVVEVIQKKLAKFGAADHGRASGRWGMTVC